MAEWRYDITIDGAGFINADVVAAAQIFATLRPEIADADHLKKVQQMFKPDDVLYHASGRTEAELVLFRQLEHVGVVLKISPFPLLVFTQPEVLGYYPSRGLYNLGEDTLEAWAQKHQVDEAYRLLLASAFVAPKVVYAEASKIKRIRSLFWQLSSAYGEEEPSGYCYFIEGWREGVYKVILRYNSWEKVVKAF